MKASHVGPGILYKHRKRIVRIDKSGEYVGWHATCMLTNTEIMIVHAAQLKSIKKGDKQLRILG